MITKASECSIRIFIRCLFEDDQSGVDNFDKIWTEYIDISGLYATREYNLMNAIHNTHVRLKAIPNIIEFQLTILADLGKPYVEGFWQFKKYGHRITWTGDADKFKKDLEFVLIQEKRYNSEIDKLKKELADVKTNGVKIDGNGRKEFIKLINDVGKFRRNDIDRDKTDMETYALMVKDYFDRPKEKR